MSESFAHRPFPRAPLIGAGLLVALSLAAVIAVRLTGTPSLVPTGTVIVERDLRFEDAADGAVRVIDARNNQAFATLPPNSNGFLRATLRGLATERKREGIGADIPFRLTAWADGRLTLEDPATKRDIELEAFGQTNAGVFAHLLQVASTQP